MTYETIKIVILNGLAHLADRGDERWRISALQMRRQAVNGSQAPLPSVLQHKGWVRALPRDEHSEGATHTSAFGVPLL